MLFLVWIGCIRVMLFLIVEHVVQFQFLNEHVLEWKWGNFMCKGQFESRIKARKRISKVCIYHLAMIGDVYFKIPTLELVPFVNDFLELFRDYLLIIHP